MAGLPNLSFSGGDAGGATSGSPVHYQSGDFIIGGSKSEFPIWFWIGAALLTAGIMVRTWKK